MEGRIIKQFTLEMVGQRGHTVLLEILCTSIIKEKIEKFSVFFMGWGGFPTALPPQ